MTHQLVFITHGVSTRKREFLGPKGWGHGFQKILAAEGRIVVPIYWGYLRFASARRFTGFYGRWRKRRAVKFIQKTVEFWEQKYPGAISHFIGHSFGTLIGYNSMFADTKYSKPVFGKVFLLASVVSSREDFSRTDSHFQDLFCFYSRDDDVVRWNPWGHSGYRGFRNSGRLLDGRMVSNVECARFEHTDYVLKNGTEIAGRIRQFLGDSE